MNRNTSPEPHSSEPAETPLRSVADKPRSSDQRLAEDLKMFVERCNAATTLSELKATLESANPHHRRYIVTQQVNEQYSALMHAAKHPSSQLCELLLRNGAQSTINAQYRVPQGIQPFGPNFDGYTALHFACKIPEDSRRSASPQIVGSLCRYGADVTLIDSSGNTPLHFAAEELAKYVKEHQVVSTKHSDLRDVVRILRYFGSDLSAKNESGRSPIDIYPDLDSIDIEQLEMDLGSMQAREDVEEKETEIVEVVVRADDTERIDELQAEIKILNERNAHLDGQDRASQQLIRELKDRTLQLEDKIAVDKKKHDSTLRKHATMIIGEAANRTEVEQQLADLRQEIAALTTQNEDLSTRAQQVSALESEITELRQTIDEQKKTIEDLRDKEEVLNDDIVQLEQDKRDLKQQLENECGLNQVLKEELEQAREENATLQEEETTDVEIPPFEDQPVNNAIFDLTQTPDDVPADGIDHVDRFVFESDDPGHQRRAVLVRFPMDADMSTTDYTCLSGMIETAVVVRPETFKYVFSEEDGNVYLFVLFFNSQQAQQQAQALSILFQYVQICEDPFAPVAVPVRVPHFAAETRCPLCQALTGDDQMFRVENCGHTYCNKCLAHKAKICMSAGRLPLCALCKERKFKETQISLPRVAAMLQPNDQRALDILRRRLEREARKFGS